MLLGFFFPLGKIGFIVTKPVLFVEVLLEKKKEKSRTRAVMFESTWQISLVRKTFYFHLPTLTILFVYLSLDFLEMLLTFSVSGLLQADTEREMLNCWFLSALPNLFLALKKNQWISPWLFTPSQCLIQKKVKSLKNPTLSVQKENLIWVHRQNSPAECEYCWLERENCSGVAEKNIEF